MQGPITVFDGDTYAGDALIQDIPPGSERLISYALDLDTEVAPESKSHPEQITSIRIAKGTLIIDRRYTRSQDYIVKNSGKKVKKVLIEYARDPNWTLVSPKEPAEKTRDKYRFVVDAKPGEPAKLVVDEERTEPQVFALTNIDENTIALYVRAEKASDKVKAALAKVIKQKQAIQDLAQKRGQLEQQIRRSARISLASARTWASWIMPPTFTSGTSRNFPTRKTNSRSSARRPRNCRIARTNSARCWMISYLGWIWPEVDDLDAGGASSSPLKALVTTLQRRNALDGRSASPLSQDIDTVDVPLRGRGAAIQCVPTLRVGTRWAKNGLDEALRAPASNLKAGNVTIALKATHNAGRRRDEPPLDFRVGRRAHRLLSPKVHKCYNIRGRCRIGFQPVETDYKSVLRVLYFLRPAFFFGQPSEGSRHDP